MLNEYLKKFRLKHNLTQEQMAEKLESTQCYYSQLESGVKKPAFSMIRRLAKVLNVSEEFVRSLL